MLSGPIAYRHQGGNFHLLLDWIGAVFSTPVEERKHRSLYLRCAEVLFQGEVLQAAHRFDALLQNDRESAPAVRS